MGKRELLALFCLSSWCFVIVVWLFLTVQQVGLQFVIVVFPDYTHLLFLIICHRVESLGPFVSTAHIPFHVCN